MKWSSVHTWVGVYIAVMGAVTEYVFSTYIRAVACIYTPHKLLQQVVRLAKIPVQTRRSRGCAVKIDFRLLVN